MKKRILSDKTARRASETYLKLAKAIAPEKNIDPRSAEDFLKLQRKITVQKDLIEKRFPIATCFDTTHANRPRYYADQILYLCHNGNIVSLVPYDSYKKTTKEDVLFLSKNQPLNESHLKASELEEDFATFEKRMQAIEGLDLNLSKYEIRTHKYTSSVDHLLSLLFSRTHYRDTEELQFEWAKQPPKRAYMPYLQTSIGLTTKPSTKHSGRRGRPHGIP